MSDYTINISKEACCLDDKDVAEKKCIDSIMRQTGAYELRYNIYLFPHGLLDTLVGISIKYPPAQIVLAIDGVTDTLITFQKIMEIHKAGNEAIKKCNCDLYLNP